MDSSGQLDDQEKLQLLKKAYRALKQELERRDESQAAERATHQRERGLLMSRTSELQRELHELKEAVRSAGRQAAARLQQLERDKPQEAAPVATPAPDAVVSLCADSAGAASASAPPASASYQRGMEWADRVLNARDVFKSAISTSLESVSALAVPQAVQDQLELQERMLEAQAQVQQSLMLDVREEQGRRLRAEAALSAEQATGAALRGTAQAAALRQAEAEARLSEGEAAQREAQREAQLAAQREAQREAQGSSQRESSQAMEASLALQARELKREHEDELHALHRALAALLRDACVACEVVSMSLPSGSLPAGSLPAGSVPAGSLSTAFAAAAPRAAGGAAPGATPLREATSGGPAAGSGAHTATPATSAPPAVSGLAPPLTSASSRGAAFPAGYHPSSNPSSRGGAAFSAAFLPDDDVEPQLPTPPTRNSPPLTAAAAPASAATATATLPRPTASSPAAAASDASDASASVFDVPSGAEAETYAAFVRRLASAEAEPLVRYLVITPPKAEPLVRSPFLLPPAPPPHTGERGGRVRREIRAHLPAARE